MAPSALHAAVEEVSAPGKIAGTELLETPEFRHLVARRWRASLVLSAVLFGVYYGFILLVATNKPLLGTRIGDGTLGILLGVLVIAASFVLTAVYVVWANRHYDPEVQRLRARLH